VVPGGLIISYVQSVKDDGTRHDKLLSVKMETCLLGSILFVMLQAYNSSSAARCHPVCSILPDDQLSMLRHGPLHINMIQKSMAETNDHLPVLLQDITQLYHPQM